MVIDASVLIAIILQEPRSAALISKLQAAPSVAIAAPAVVETAMVLSRHLGGDPTVVLNAYLEELRVAVIPSPTNTASSPWKRSFVSAKDGIRRR